IRSKVHPNRPLPPALPEEAEDSETILERIEQERPAAPPLPEDSPTPKPNFFGNLIRRLQIIPWTHPLAYSFLMEAEPQGLRGRFEISILKQSESEVTLKFTPRQSVDRATFVEVLVLLSRQDYQVRALKFVETSELSTVYVLRDRRINQPPSHPYV